MLHAVIMAGGGGTRFWPRSRSRRPKQFLSMTGDRSLIQNACDRLEGLAAPEQTWIITGERYRDLTREQLPGVPPAQIIGEPCGRDTAPCIGLGAALIARQDPDATMIVTPADHVIEPEQEFRRAVQVAVQLAEDHPSAFIIFGIAPTFPATGYGYVHRGAEYAVRQGVQVFHVQGFKEKPVFDVAERYVTSGEYYWNSGIFIWKVKTILDALQRNQPAIHAAVTRIADAWDTPRRDEVFAKEFAALSKISIDFAVMESAKEVLMVQAPYKWDDVGSWLALERMQPQDANGNTVMAEHAGIGTTGSIIVGEAGKLIATVGVEDLIIIQDGDAVLVASKKDEGVIKNLVNLLNEKRLEKYL